MMRRALVVVCAFLSLTATAFEQPDNLSAPFAKNLSKDAERWVEKTLKGMSTEEKVGQLIQVRAYAEFQNAEDPTYVELRDNIQKYHLGSVILTVRSEGAFLQRNQPYEAAMMTNQLQRDSKLPLLIAADFERGLNMRLQATPAFPHAMAFAATPDAVANEEKFAEIVARESRAIGVHWNYFPVADVNINPANPIINIRSFGEDPKQVSAMVNAYVRGSRAGGLLSTAKHFPGHGDTDSDTHIAAARVNASLDRLEQVELAPFKSAVAEGLDSVMVAHVTVPSLDPSPTAVAGLSHKIVTDVLKNELGFKGLIVTDAMEMKAMAGVYGDNPAGQTRSIIDAILAGNDMVLLPANLDGAFNGLVAAVKDGRITEDELDLRVRKILRAKASLGLNKSRTVDVSKLRENVGKPQDLAFAQQVADAAITLVKKDSQAIELLRTERKTAGTNSPAAAYPEQGPVSREGVFALIALEDMRSDWGRAFERELRARVPRARVLYVDARNAGAMMEAVTEATIRSDAVIIAAFAVPVSGARVETDQGVKGATSVQADVSHVIDRVLKIAPERTTFVAVGNPYLGTQYRPNTYICTYSNAVSAEIAAVKALLGEVPFKGKLPVTIPGIAQRGAGLDVSIQ